MCSFAGVVLRCLSYVLPTGPLQQAPGQGVSGGSEVLREGPVRAEVQILQIPTMREGGNGGESTEKHGSQHGCTDKEQEVDGAARRAVEAECEEGGQLSAHLSPGRLVH